MNNYNVSQILTFFRLGASVLLVPPLFLSVDWAAGYAPARVLLIVCWFILSLTDFFDGWLARRYGLQTTLGQVADHVADKIFVSTLLILFAGAGRIASWVVVLLVAREFFVLGIREAALCEKFQVPVDRLGKYKAAAQMVLLGWLMLKPVAEVGIIDTMLIMLTLALSSISAWGYARAYLRQRGHSSKK
jgi:CDP-diacylglycerol--glycerol-3-phosphate 3-phosphatidyltransferase